MAAAVLNVLVVFSLQLLVVQRNVLDFTYVYVVFVFLLLVNIVQNINYILKTSESMTTLTQKMFPWPLLFV